MPSNLQIILLAGAALIFLVILYLFFKPLFTRKLIQNSLDDSSSMLFQEDVEQGTLGFDDEGEAVQEQLSGLTKGQKGGEDTMLQVRW